VINEIEDSIVKRLRAKIPPPIRVEAFPDSPSGYQFLTPHGSVFVRFEGEDLVGISQSMGIIKQDSTMTFVITVLHRNLRVQGGIYQYLDQVKTALRGFRPIPGSSKIWINKSGFVGEEQGTWHYEIWASLLMPQVEKPDPEPNLPVAHHLSFDGNFGVLSIAENEAEDPSQETVTFSYSPENVSRTEPMPPHDEGDD
jgi:hypothetical protein